MCRSSAIDSRFLFTIIVHRRMAPGVTLRQLFQLLVWSLEHARRGEFPTVDHLSRPWPVRCSDYPKIAQRARSAVQLGALAAVYAPGQASPLPCALLHMLARYDLFVGLSVCRSVDL